MELSHVPRKGKVVRIDGDTGRIQPEGERGLVFFRTFWRRAVVLDQDGKPIFGSKSTRRSISPLTEGEEVMFLLEEDSHGRPRAHVVARLNDWLRTEKIGTQMSETTSMEGTNVH